MGIKSLTYLIKTKGTPECIETKNLNELAGKRVAIDASLFIYQSLINIRRDGDFIKNKKDEVISHLMGIFNKTSHLLSLNIKPIYIFDGKPPKEKQEIINIRKENVREYNHQLETETDIAKINALKKKTVRITFEYIDEIKSMLTLMGVPYIHMDGEAEGLASELCRMNYVDYVMTEDMDSLVFGCPMLIRKCIHKNSCKDSISVFNLKEILSSFDITYEQFMELCILCGCDYCSNINRVGNVTAFKLIKQYGSIEKIIEYNNKYHKYDIPDDYIEKFNTSKSLFNIFNGKIDIEKIDIHKSEINYEELEKYLIHKIEMPTHKINIHIEKIKNGLTI
jgi:flap endonuclease-1